MDPSNPDDWTKLATAFTNAPLWAVMMATGAIVGGAVWWVRGKVSDREIDGLKGQIAVLKEQIATWELRLKLADDLVAASDRATKELDKQFQDYKAKVAIEGRNASPAKMEAAIVRVANVNTEIKDKLVAALMSREIAKKIDLPRGTGYPDPNE
jgi:hypothetical protein